MQTHDRSFRPPQDPAAPLYQPPVDTRPAPPTSRRYRYTDWASI